MYVAWVASPSGKKPPHTPKALTTEQIAAIPIAAREWCTGEGAMGPRSGGQVRDIIEVVLGTATRIAERSPVPIAAGPMRPTRRRMSDPSTGHTRIALGR